MNIFERKYLRDSAECDKIMGNLSKIKNLLKKDQRGLNIREISEKLNINRNSVAKLLDILTAKEEVEFRIHGRSKIYYLAKPQDYRKWFELLSRTVEELNNFPPDGDIYAFIAGTLKHITPEDTIISINSFDQDTKTITINAIEGLGPRQPDIEAILCRPLNGLGFSVPDQALPEMLTGECNEIPGGLTDLTFGWLPYETCKKIEAMPFFGKVYSAGISWKGRLNGAATFILPQGADLENHDLITFFIRQVAGFLSRRDAEAALKESEQFNREIIHNTKEGVVVYDRNFNYLVWNPFMESLSGISASEARGKNGFDLFPHLREQKVDILLQRALAGETVRSPDIPYHVPQTKKSGWVSGIYSPHFNGQGEIIGVIGNIRDITERKRTEEALRENESYVKSILHSSPVPQFALDNNHHVVSWNKAIEEYSGIKEAEVLGTRDQWKAFYDAERPVLADLMIDEAVEKLPELYPGKFKKSPFVEGAYEVTDFFPKMGTRGVWLHFTTAPIRDAKGAIIGAVETLEDITERKRAEEALEESKKRFRELSDLLPQAVYEMDAKGILTYANRIAFDMFDYTREEFEQGLNVLNMIAQQDRERAKDAICEILNGKPQLGSMEEYLALRKDGSTFPISNYSSPIIVKDRITGLRGIIIDITAQKRQEQILRTQLNLSLTLQSIRGLYDSLKTCLLAAIEISGMDAGGIYLVDEMSGSVDLIVSLNLGDEFVKSVSHYPAGSANAQMVMAGKPIYVQYNKTGIVLTSVQEREGLRILAIIPVISKGRVIACIKISSHISDEIPANARLGVEMIATQIGTAIDRIQAEEALAQNEQKYRNVVEDQTEFICRFLPDGTHVFVNESYCRYFGLNRDEILGHRFRPKIPAEDKERVRRFFESLTTDHPVDIIEHRIIMADGSIRWQRWVDRAIFHLGGSLKEYQSVGRDITEFKRAEQALRVSEMQLRATLESTADGILAVDNKGKVLQASRRFAELWRIPQFLMERGDDRALLDFVLDQLNDPDAFLMKVQSLYRSDAVDMDTLTFKDGRVFERYSFPIIMDGARIGRVWSFRDITDRKKAEDALHESEEMFRTLLLHVPSVAVQGYSMDGTTNYWDDASENLYGYSAEEAIGKNLVELIIPPEMREEVRKAIMYMAETGQSIPASELSLMKKDGSRVAVFSSHVIIKRPQGKMDLYCLDIDLTERKRAEEVIRQANKKLNLLSGITRHDIKNQLLLLSGYLALSEKTLDNIPLTLEYIQKEKKIADTISHQISFTKDYEDMGVKAPAWQKVNAVISRVITRLPMRNIRVDAGDPDLEIFADPLLEKMFYNLIDNALRYGGEQMTTICITNRKHNGNLVIAVEDDGKGISADDKKQLFTKNFGKHTGLGLFLSREILDITGITIRETGEPGKGARFEIVVPKGAYRITGVQ